MDFSHLDVQTGTCQPKQVNANSVFPSTAGTRHVCALFLSSTVTFTVRAHSPLAPA